MLIKKTRKKLVVLLETLLFVTGLFLAGCADKPERFETDDCSGITYDNFQITNESATDTEPQGETFETTDETVTVTKNNLISTLSRKRELYPVLKNTRLKYDMISVAQKRRASYDLAYLIEIIRRIKLGG